MDLNQTMTKTVLVLPLFILTGCSTQPINEQPTVIRDNVPTEMTSKVSQPPLIGNTVGDLMDTHIQTKGALQKCNDKLDAIRDWSDEK